MDILRGYSLLAPWKCGNTEPLRIDCSAMSTEDVVAAYWGDFFMWSSAKHRMHGIADEEWGKTAIFVYGRVADRIVRDIYECFETTTTQLPVDFGWIHILGDSERIQYRSDPKRMLNPFNAGVTYPDLAGGIPNLGWVTIFGKPYAERIEKRAIEKIAARVWAPSEQVRLPMFVQLTSQARDVLGNFSEFDSLRQRAKTAIGEDLFKSVGHDAKWVPLELRLPPPVKTIFSDLDKLNRSLK